MATPEELAKALDKQYREEFETSQQAAIDAREENAAQPETEEEYYARVSSVSGVFGDTETSVATEVPSANNEQAGVEVAEKDAAVEQGDEEAAELSDDEARRQTDVELGTTDSAEAVDEEAPDDNTDES